MSCEERKKAKIAVIGAGLSGLTTAFRLASRGYDVQVYEARHRVGGRLLSVRVQGHVAELGGENIFNGGQAAHTSALIDDLQLKTEIARTPFSTHPFEKTLFSSFHAFLRAHPFAFDLKQRLTEIAKEAKNMHEVLLSLFPERGLAYKLTKTMLAGYEGAPTEFLSVFYIGTLFYMLQGGLCSAHQNTNTEETIPYIDRMTIAGGNSNLPIALSEKLQGRVHLQHVLQELSKDPDGQYTLLFRNGHRITADIVVLSMPCPVYRDISISDNVLPAERKNAIESICYGTPSKVLVPMLESASIGKQYVHEDFVAFLSADKDVATLYYVGGHGQFSKAELEQKFARDFPLLQQIYTLDASMQPLISCDEPFHDYKTAVGHSWPNDPFARGAYSCIGAGQEELFASLSRCDEEIVKTLFAPIDGTLFFAGEHTSILLDLGGTIEAAVESGERAARLITKRKIWNP